MAFIMSQALAILVHKPLKSMPFIVFIFFVLAC